jgi:hypothetical protein
MSTFTKSGLDGISADGPSADVVSERRPVTTCHGSQRPELELGQSTIVIARGS